MDAPDRAVSETSEWACPVCGGEIDMNAILVTGASGFIGSALTKALAKDSHDVIAVSRSKVEQHPGVTVVNGAFHSFEDLRKLDAYGIDAVVHLAAVTGGHSERDGMMVNVEGTRRLMRYLIDRRCRKFVMASSIAAVGMEDPHFCPVEVPMPDEHPCLDKLGYGFSKFMMEEVTKYYSRQSPDIDVINLRLAAILPDDSEHCVCEVTPGEPYPWAIGSISMMFLSDTVRLLTLAAQSAHKPGVRIMNAVAPKIASSLSVPEILTKPILMRQLMSDRYGGQSLTSGALADFTRAIEIDPNNAAPYLGRGIIRRRLRNFEGALQDHDRAVTLGPGTPELYMARGATRAVNGDLRGAVDDFTKASTLDPNPYRAYLWRAYAYVALKETDRAVADLNNVRQHATDPILRQRSKELLREILVKPTMER